jgi:hypothetical protein
MKLALAAEKRRFPRWSGGKATFSVRCGVTAEEVTLVDFSSGGMSVVFERAQLPAQDGNVPLFLAHGGAPFARVLLGVANDVRGRSSIRVGGPILESSLLPFGRESARGPGDASALGSGDVVRDVLLRLRKQAPPLRLVFESGSVCTARLRAFEVGGPISFVVDGNQHGSLPKPGVGAYFAFALNGSGFELHGSIVQIEGRPALAPPFAVVSRSRRHADRVRVPGPGRRAVLSWPNLLTPGERVLGDIEDLSALGARVRPRSPSSYPPPPPGEPVRLHVDGLALNLHIEVRHAEEGGAFGVRFVPACADDAVRLARAVERVSFPSLLPRASVPREDVASLFRSSGYLALRESAQALTPWHDAAFERLSVDAVHQRADGTLDGHASCTRIYRRTWIFHQLATLGQGRLAMKARRAIYLSMTGWVSLLSEGDGHAIAYFDRAKRWHASLFEDFIAWCGNHTIATITPLDRFEIAAAEATAFGSVDVGPAREDELLPAEQVVSAAMPPILAAATDIEAPLLSTGTLCDAHDAEGLGRERVLLVAREEGRASAYALCETGSPNLSLFNLLNLAHVVTTPGASLDAQRALLAAVSRFYASRGISAPLVVAKPGTLTAADSAGCSLVETMGCLVLSAEGLKQYRNFLAYHFGRFEKTSGLDRPDSAESVAE